MKPVYYSNYCVLLNTNTAESHHPHCLDETPVGGGEIDGGREGSKKGKEASGVGLLSTFLAAELENTTWLKLRRSTRVSLDHIRHLLIVHSHKYIID